MTDAEEIRYSEDDLIDAASCINAYLYTIGGSISFKDFLDSSRHIIAIDPAEDHIYVPSLEDRLLGLIILISMDHVDIDLKAAKITLSVEGQICGSAITRKKQDWREAML